MFYERSLSGILYNIYNLLFVISCLRYDPSNFVYLYVFLFVSKSILCVIILVAYAWLLYALLYL